jgi:acetoin:2,6-dichlorophenolindophenol oxidoreductase subunit alpha
VRDTGTSGGQSTEQAQRSRKAFAAMLASRLLEEGLAKLFAEGKVHGNLHLGVGEEATAAGGAAALIDGDYLFPTHRGLASVIYRGMSLRRIAAQALGRAAGPSRGKSDITHVADPELGIMGFSASIGGNFGLALGTAWASAYRNDERVTLCCFGDGAVNRGTFLESANMMVLWNAPVVMLCDNNQYAVSVASKDMLSGAGIAERAAAFGMPGRRVDGNDFDAVFSAAAEAVARARSGGGPSLVEALTYRQRGHYEGDKGAYRPAGELEYWLARDPITRYRAQMVSLGWPEEELRSVERRVQDEVADALGYALAAAWPDVSTVTEGVFA